MICNIYHDVINSGVFIPRKRNQYFLLLHTKQIRMRLSQYVFRHLSNLRGLVCTSLLERLLHVTFISHAGSQNI